MADLGHTVVSKFSDIKEFMNTYDLLLFRGNDIISNTIATVETFEDGLPKNTTNNYTHVGLVIRGRDLMPRQTDKDPTEKDWLCEDEVYILESTMSGDLAGTCTDVHGEAHFGVQLRLLSEVVIRYSQIPKAELAWCPLVVPLPSPAKETVRAEYEKYRGLSYDMSIVDLAACAFKPVRRLRDNTVFEHLRDAICYWFWRTNRADGAGTGADNLPSRWQFCSEMVANIFKDIKLLSGDVVPADTMPCDFVTDPDHPDKTLDKDKEIPLLFFSPISYSA
jgi:hypothetical protein